MRVVFLQATNPIDVQWNAPIGFGYIKAYLDQGLPGRIEVTIAGNVHDALAAKPDVVGISAFSQDFEEAKKIALQIRENSEAFLVLGGQHISALPDTLPSMVDVGIIGEGELTFSELMQMLEEAGSKRSSLFSGLAHLPGIVYRTEAGKIQITKNRELVGDLDSLPMPDRRLRASGEQSPYLFSSRGCPYTCSFCASSVYWRRYRMHSAERVVHEMESILREFPDTTHLKFWDDLFVADRNRLQRIAELAETRGLPVKATMDCTVRANLVDDDLCSLLKRLNVVAVSFGAESGSNRILKTLKSGVDVSTNQRALDLLYTHKVPVACSFVVGVPGETEEDVRATYEFILRNTEAGKLGFFDVNILTPMPGSAVWKEAERQGIVGSDMNWNRLRYYASRQTNAGGLWRWASIRRENRSIYLNEDTLPESRLVGLMEEYEMALSGGRLGTRSNGPVGRRTSVLIISGEVISDNMTGPGVRSWEIARALSEEYAVSIAAPNKDGRVRPEVSEAVSGQPSYEVIFDSQDALQQLAEEADAILLSGATLHEFPFIAALKKPLIVDLYAPIVLENLELALGLDNAQALATHRTKLGSLRELIGRGEFFLCASEQQRTLILGLLIANNRINPLIYAQDRSLRNLADVVPFGLPSGLPQRRRQVIKGIYPGIGADDEVVLWSGSILQGLDPLTLVRAMTEIVPKRPKVKLFFLHFEHPNQGDAFEMDVTGQAVGLSKELGLYNRHVFFGERVSYVDREDYLLEADLGVSLQLDRLETHFSSQTRLLDYIWAAVPMVVTRGHALAEMVSRHQLGRVVEPLDSGAVAEAILTMLHTPNLRSSMESGFAISSGQLTWDNAVVPLASFLASPTRATESRRQDLSDLAGEKDESSLAERLRQREAEIVTLKGLVDGYERGRMLRALNALGRARQRWLK